MHNHNNLVDPDQFATPASFERALAMSDYFKVTTNESKRVTDEREPVIYMFRNDAYPWLLTSTQMRYDGLAQDMRRSKMENFEVLVKTLRELSPSAPFDVRLLAATKYVPVADNIKGFQEIVAGKHDDVPERAFYMAGGIDEVLANAERIRKES